MRLYTIAVVSDSGYAPATMNVIAEDAIKACEKALFRYNGGKSPRIVSLEDKGLAVL